MQSDTTGPIKVILFLQNPGLTEIVESVSVLNLLKVHFLGCMATERHGLGRRKSRYSLQS